MHTYTHPLLTTTHFHTLTHSLHLYSLIHTRTHRLPPSRGLLLLGFVLRVSEVGVTFNGRPLFKCQVNQNRLRGAKTKERLGSTCRWGRAREDVKQLQRQETRTPPVIVPSAPPLPYPSPLVPYLSHPPYKRYSASSRPQKKKKRKTCYWFVIFRGLPFCLFRASFSRPTTFLCPLPLVAPECAKVK